MLRISRVITDVTLHVFAGFEKVLAIRTEKWKLVEFADEDWEFHDLAREPGELKDLSALDPNVAAPPGALGRQAIDARASSYLSSSSSARRPSKEWGR
jgi:hypothetical protein